jgi:hypothetical protein
MSWMSLAEARQWFSSDKIDMSVIDVTLEASAMDIVRAAVRTRYDTSTWISPATTPGQVRTVISLLHGAWWFNRVASESMQMEFGSGYGDRLESLAMSLLGGIAGGSTSLEDDFPVLTNAQLAFYPTDATTEDGTTPRFADMTTVF